MTGNDVLSERCMSVVAVQVGNGILERKSQRALRRAHELLCSSSGIDLDVSWETNCGKLARLILYANNHTEGDGDAESTTEFASLKLGR